MWIFGYNENKQVIEVNVPMATVLTKQIDPWRLDLYDSNPVVYTTPCGQTLRFRRLRDIAFAYQVGSRTIVCMHDGVQTACLESETAKFFKSDVRIVNPRNSEGSFNEHLLNFWNNGGYMPWHGIEQDKPFAYARAAEAVKLSASAVEVYDHDTMFVKQYRGLPVFTGEMFDIVPVSLNLPDEINWVFKTFADLHPVISSRSLKQVMAGLDWDMIEMYVEPARMADFQSRLEVVAKQVPFHVQKFGSSGHVHFTDKHSGVMYYVLSSSFDGTLARLQSPGHLTQFEELSSGGVYATGVNQVHATRIALYDIPRRKVRALSLASQESATTLDSMDKLQLIFDDGWSLEPLVLSNKADIRTSIDFNAKALPRAKKKRASSVTRKLAA